MIKKQLAFILVIILILGVFSGCSQSGTNGNEEQTPESTTPVTQAPDAPGEETPPATQPEAEISPQPEPQPEPEPEEEPSFPLAQSRTVTVWDVFPPPLAGFMEGPWECTAVVELEKATNVKLNYTIVSTETAVETFNLMVISGAYCDMIYGIGDYYVGGADKAIDDDVVIDLLDLSQSIPNLQTALEKTPDALQLTSSGKMYHFPVIVEKPFNDGVRGLNVRGDWLEQLGMDSPETLDEFYEMLKAFKTEKGSNGALLLDSNGFIPAVSGGFDSTYGFYLDDGAIKYGPSEPGFIEYIEYMTKLYSEGLVQKDFYTLMGPPTNLITTGEVSVWSGDVSMISFFTSGITDSDYYITGISYPTKTAGEKIHFNAEPNAWIEGFGVSTKCSDLEFLSQLVNYMYGDEFMLLANYGVEGEGFNYVNGEPQLTELVLDNQETITTFAAMKYTLFGYLPHRRDQTRLMPAYSESQLESLDLWADSSDGGLALPSDFKLDLDDSERVAMILSDIETYVDEALLGYITGAIPIEQVSVVPERVKELNIGEALTIYQTAWDEYNQ